MLDRTIANRLRVELALDAKFQAVVCSYNVNALVAARARYAGLPSKFTERIRNPVFKLMAVDGDTRGVKSLKLHLVTMTFEIGYHLAIASSVLNAGLSKRMLRKNSCMASVLLSEVTNP
jgi:hypothetical protein